MVRSLPWPARAPHTRKSWNPWLATETAGALATHGPSARALCVRLAGDGCAQGRLGLLPATAHRRRVEEPHRPRANTAWAAEPAGVARCRVGSQTRTRVLARLSAIRMRALTDKQLGICRARTVTGSSEREGGGPMRCGRCSCARIHLVLWAKRCVLSLHGSVSARRVRVWRFEAAQHPPPPNRLTGRRQ